MTKAIAAIKTLVLLVFGFRPNHRDDRPNKKRHESRVENCIRTNSLRGLLDDLDNYMTIMHQLKVVDRDAYDLFSQIGAAVGGADLSLLSPDHYGLTDDFLRQPPSFGFLYLSHGDDENCVPAIYFSKFRWRSCVEPFDGPIYELCVYINNRKKLRGIYWCHVGIANDGKIKLLKERIQKTVRLPKNKGSFVRTEWSIPTWIELFCKDGRWDNPDQWAAGAFTLAANHTVNYRDGFRVSVSNGRVRGAFRIDLLRTPYFFRDRDLTVTQNGHRRKIFHIVRTHSRNVNGKERFVKSHFRGERRFQWNGFNVLITMPGLHHAEISDFTCGLLDSDDVKGRGLVGIREAGKIFRESMEAAA